ncbi:Protein SIP3 [Gossypium arboreum]|uniref:Protein SIP3 n=1 Tax=Gossypium arboreum TaxID=29729 RepID=A0A0B0MN04_GOSAR|nr:Protein SIP3 [Gossypium arboreum]
MLSHINSTVPNRVLHESNMTKTHIPMPTPQTWSYTKTHISMPTSQTWSYTKTHIKILWFVRAFGCHNSVKTNSLT